MPRACSFVVVVGIAVATRAAAQPAACPACARGDALIDQLSLEPLRAMAGELAALSLSDPLTAREYARIVELRRRTPELVRLGAVDDAGIAAIAVALCRGPAPACTVVTARALRCLADRCDAEVPAVDPRRPDSLRRRRNCPRAGAAKRTSPIGVGFEWGTGWHDSRYPRDGRVWSFGIDTRLRLGNGRFGAVARIDRNAGRDESTDVDADGNDDVWTGSITRISGLAGPSLVFDYSRYENRPRFLRLDLLGGYVSTRSQPDESGPAAGVDLAYQLAAFRLGVRFVQGFADAQDATTLVVHYGITVGAPPYPDGDCDDDERDRRSGSRVALGIDIPLFGYGFASDLGLLATGYGVELAFYLSQNFDAVARADILLYPGDERERTIHQAALAGLRVDRGLRDDDAQTGWFVTALGGYTHGAGITPTTSGTGPVGDLALGWGIQSGEAAANFRLHARFGLGDDNRDYRAILLSGGFEIRFDPRRWRPDD